MSRILKNVGCNKDCINKKDCLTCSKMSTQTSPSNKNLSGCRTDYQLKRETTRSSSDPGCDDHCGSDCRSCDAYLTDFYLNYEPPSTDPIVFNVTTNTDLPVRYVLELIAQINQAIAVRGVCFIAIGSGDPVDILSQGMFGHATENKVKRLEHKEKLTEEDRYWLADTPCVSPSVLRSVQWDKVHIFIADDRPVPHSSPLSTFAQVQDEIAFRLTPPPNVYSSYLKNTPPHMQAYLFMDLVRDVFRREMAASGKYARMSHRDYPLWIGWPRLDVVMLGIDKEGNTPSLFKHDPKLTSIPSYIPRTFDFDISDVVQASGRPVYLLSPTSRQIDNSNLIQGRHVCVTGVDYEGEYRGDIVIKPVRSVNHLDGRNPHVAVTALETMYCYHTTSNSTSEGNEVLLMGGVNKPVISTPSNTPRNKSQLSGPYDRKNRRVQTGEMEEQLKAMNCDREEEERWNNARLSHLNSYDRMNQLDLENNKVCFTVPALNRARCVMVVAIGGSKRVAVGGAINDYKRLNEKDVNGVLKQYRYEQSRQSELRQSKIYAVPSMIDQIRLPTVIEDQDGHSERDERDRDSKDWEGIEFNRNVPLDVYMLKDGEMSLLTNRFESYNDSTKQDSVCQDCRLKVRLSDSNYSNRCQCPPPSYPSHSEQVFSSKKQERLFRDECHTSALYDKQYINGVQAVSMIRPRYGQVKWFVDDKAASLLDSMRKQR